MAYVPREGYSSTDQSLRSLLIEQSFYSTDEFFGLPCWLKCGACAMKNAPYSVCNVEVTW
jgi:hypothetical protein